MKIVCLDLEGVLLPEFWEEFSKATNIPELMKTTRDEPDYDKLMQMRLRVLKENGYGIKEIREVANKMQPLEGAPEFLDWLRERAQVTILTGSYYDYIMPLMKKLGYPLMFANKLDINADGEITGYRLREKDGKIEMINRFIDAGFETIAIGDSNNDKEMLCGANYGIAFKGKPRFMQEMKRNGCYTAENYPELQKVLTDIL